MEKETIIVEMTPFLFEDGNTYYFDIKKRSYGNTYHNLFVYKQVEVVKERKTWFGLGATEKKVEIKYQCINPNNAALVNINLNAREVKNEIKSVIIANQAVHRIKDWDGFVGDIPEDAKKALSRDSKLNDLGIK
jgi:hypothetical protein